jgi:hypothetical protein
MRNLRAITLLLSCSLVGLACGGDDTVEIEGTPDGGGCDGSGAVVFEASGGDVEPNVPDSSTADSGGDATEEGADANDAQATASDAGGDAAATDDASDSGSDAAGSDGGGVDSSADASSSDADAGGDTGTSETDANDSGLLDGASQADANDAMVDATHQPCDASACNCLPNSGRVVPITASDVPLPPPLGGTFPIGSYVLTAATYYGAGTDGGIGTSNDGGPPTLEELAMFDGPFTQYVVAVNGGADDHESATITFTDAGTGLVVTFTCGNNGTIDEGFTVLAAQTVVLIYVPINGVTYQLTFTLK